MLSDDCPYADIHVNIAGQKLLSTDHDQSDYRTQPILFL